MKLRININKNGRYIIEQYSKLFFGLFSIWKQLYYIDKYGYIQYAKYKTLDEAKYAVDRFCREDSAIKENIKNFKGPLIYTLSK